MATPKVYSRTARPGFRAPAVAAVESWALRRQPPASTVHCPAPRPLSGFWTSEPAASDRPDAICIPGNTRFAPGKPCAHGRLMAETVGPHPRAPKTRVRALKWIFRAGHRCNEGIGEAALGLGAANPLFTAAGGITAAARGDLANLKTLQSPHEKVNRPARQFGRGAPGPLRITLPVPMVLLWHCSPPKAGSGRPSRAGFSTCPLRVYRRQSNDRPPSQGRFAPGR